jgi:ATP-dependent DNA helicase RecQ
MESYCANVRCRHQSLVEYFGQPFDAAGCQACDVCLGEVELVADSLVVAQKIISCVLRLRESYGADHTARVLVGSNDERIVDRGHHQLSTWGILQDQPQKVVRAWIEQLVAQQFLLKTGEYNVLSVTATGRDVLRGEGDPRLSKPAERAKRASKVATESWEGVDRPLFERLRAWRRATADSRGLPPFVVFGDATLRDLARRRPSTLAELLDVHGIGEHKRNEYGAEVLAEIAAHCDGARDSSVA